MQDELRLLTRSCIYCDGNTRYSSSGPKNTLEPFEIIIKTLLLETPLYLRVKHTISFPRQLKTRRVVCTRVNLVLSRIVVSQTACFSLFVFSHLAQINFVDFRAA